MSPFTIQLASFLITAFTALAGFYFTRRNTKRDDSVDLRARVRELEEICEEKERRLQEATADNVRLMRLLTLGDGKRPH